MYSIEYRVYFHLIQKIPVRAMSSMIMSWCENVIILNGMLDLFDCSLFFALSDFAEDLVMLFFTFLDIDNRSSKFFFVICSFDYLLPYFDSGCVFFYIWIFPWRFFFLYISCLKKAKSYRMETCADDVIRMYSLVFLCFPHAVSLFVVGKSSWPVWTRMISLFFAACRE